MAARPGQLKERLRHECRAQPVQFGDRLDHVFEERVPIGGDQRRGVLPVHLELAVGVFVVALVRAPAQRQHGVADRRDHLVAAHQRGLVVARLGLPVGTVGNRRPVRRDQEEFALNTGLHGVAVHRRRPDQALQHDARRLRDGLAGHPRIAGQPADLRLPRQLDQAGRIGHHQHVRIGRRHVEPGREPGEPGAVAHHLPDRRRRHQLGPHGAEQVQKRNEEVLDAARFRLGRQIDRPRIGCP